MEEHTVPWSWNMKYAAVWFPPPQQQVAAYDAFVLYVRRLLLCGWSSCWGSQVVLGPWGRRPSCSPHRGAPSGSHRAARTPSPLHTQRREQKTELVTSSRWWSSYTSKRPKRNLFLSTEPVVLCCTERLDQMAVPHSAHTPTTPLKGFTVCSKLKLQVANFK